MSISAAEQTLEGLHEEIRKAHVICVVYAVDDDESLERISSYWLPLIREVCSEGNTKPVVLVGNKIDLISYSTINVIATLAVDRLVFLKYKSYFVFIVEHIRHSGGLSRDRQLY